MSVAISTLMFFGRQIKALVDLTRDERIAAINGLSPAVGATIAYTTRREQGFDRDLGEEKNCMISGLMLLQKSALMIESLLWSVGKNLVTG